MSTEWPGWVQFSSDTEGGNEFVQLRSLSRVTDTGNGSRLYGPGWVVDVLEAPSVIMEALGVYVAPSAKPSPAPAATEPAPGSEEDWREALRVVREVEPNARSYAGLHSVSVESGPGFRLSVFSDGVGSFGWFDCRDARATTATAAARAYVASRRADPTPERIAEVRTGQAVDGPLVVDGWTLEGEQWVHSNKTTCTAIDVERGCRDWLWRASACYGDPLTCSTAPTRAEALAAATTALRTHYGRPT